MQLYGSRGARFHELTHRLLNPLCLFFDYRSVAWLVPRMRLAGRDANTKTTLTMPRAALNESRQVV
jgi:hypothetical protein